MSERYLLAIDNGSQSTKVSVVDEDGRVRATAQRALRPYATTPSGHVVHPDDDLWASVTTTCRQALELFEGDREQIVGVGLCTIRFCRALLDADGLLVEPVLSWMDRRVSLPHDAHDPRVAHVTTSSGYITHRLTGRFLDTRANYQGLWPIDRRTGEWPIDAAAYTATGMPRALLSDLVSPGELLGRVTPEAAETSSLPVGLPVYATANDKAVEALGCGLRDENTVLLSLGTYIAAMSVGSGSEAVDDGYWVNFGATPSEFLYESHGIRRGMWTVSWFRDLVADGPPSATSSEYSSFEQVLDSEASSVPPGCEGLMTLLDWLPPAEAPQRRGAILGFDGSQGRGHVHRSILEGIALTMRGHVTRMERSLDRCFTTLVVSGGGSRSDLFMQILADVFNRPTRRTAMPDAAGLGAAISAAVGAGVHPDFDTAVERMVHVGKTFEPNQTSAAAYTRIGAAYATLTEHTDPLFTQVQALTGDWR